MITEPDEVPESVLLVAKLWALVRNTKVAFVFVSVK
jgi:hypothetical protein